MKPDDVFFCGDFENSTDYIQHGHGRILLKTFFTSLGFDSSYVLGAVDLLLSPR
jgi:hypothetical protein